MSLFCHTFGPFAKGMRVAAVASFLRLCATRSQGDYSRFANCEKESLRKYSSPYARELEALDNRVAPRRLMASTGE